MFDREVPGEAAEPVEPLPAVDFRVPDAVDHEVISGAVADALQAWADAAQEDRLAWARRQVVRDAAVEQARILSTDVAALSPDAALDALAALQVQMSRLQAMEYTLLVRAAGASRVERDVLVEDVDPDTGAATGRAPRRVTLFDEVLEEIACCLRRPGGSVRSQLAVARMLAGPLTATQAQLAGGRITGAHAAAIAEQAARMQDGASAGRRQADPLADPAFVEACEALEDRVLPHAERETATQTRARARRAVAAIDAAGAAARRRRARTGCDVRVVPLDDGLALIEAVLPALDAARAMAAIDHDTREAIAAGALDELGLDADATLGQVRAAVLARALLSNPGETASARSTRVEIGVLIDAATLAGLNPDGPVWVRPGTGEPTDVARADLLDLLADPSIHPVLRRLVTDPLTGALVDHGAATYRVTASLRAWLNARDGGCTFPSCTRPAHRCDVDHTIDYADGGPTTRENTRLMCRRHHNGKTHAGWQITDTDPDGSCTFISPSGRVYRHEPVELVSPPPRTRLPRPPDPAGEPIDTGPPPF